MIVDKVQWKLLKIKKIMENNFLRFTKLIGCADVKACLEVWRPCASARRRQCWSRLPALGKLSNNCTAQKYSVKNSIKFWIILSATRVLAHSCPCSYKNPLAIYTPRLLLLRLGLSWGRQQGFPFHDQCKYCGCNSIEFVFLKQRFWLLSLIARANLS
jgi:hypothetical protein